MPGRTVGAGLAPGLRWLARMFVATLGQSVRPPVSVAVGPVAAAGLEGRRDIARVGSCCTPVVEPPGIDARGSVVDHIFLLG